MTDRIETPFDAAWKELCGRRASSGIKAKAIVMVRRSDLNAAVAAALRAADIAVPVSVEETSGCSIDRAAKGTGK
ncbi:MAG: hypothetical protein ING19_08895 [Azospirillum sp.]|nr:hypothetical protein [Azospirillum sp.]